MHGAKLSYQFCIKLSWSCIQYFLKKKGEKKKLNSQLVGFSVSLCSLSHFNEVVGSAAAEGQAQAWKFPCAAMEHLPWYGPL